MYYCMKAGYILSATLNLYNILSIYTVCVQMSNRNPTQCKKCYFVAQEITIYCTFELRILKKEQKSTKNRPSLSLVLPCTCRTDN